MLCEVCHIKMEKIDRMANKDYTVLTMLANPYWKCPKCKVEVDDE